MKRKVERGGQEPTRSAAPGAPRNSGSASPLCASGGGNYRNTAPCFPLPRTGCSIPPTPGARRRLAACCPRGYRDRRAPTLETFIPGSQKKDELPGDAATPQGLLPPAWWAVNVGDGWVGTSRVCIPWSTSLSPHLLSLLSCPHLWSQFPGLHPSILPLSPSYPVFEG